MTRYTLRRLSDGSPLDGTISEELRHKSLTATNRTGVVQAYVSESGEWRVADTIGTITLAQQLGYFVMKVYVDEHE